MIELEYVTSTSASTRRSFADTSIESTALLTFSTPESATTVGGKLGESRCRLAATRMLHVVTGSRREATVQASTLRE